jgi:CRP-like cAMP-binding protein
MPAKSAGRKPAIAPTQLAPGERATNGRILRLVRSEPERRALEAGEVDAVLDDATGTVILLPEARRALSSAGHGIANSLLAALPREDYRNLLGELDAVTLTAREVLYEPGERIRHVYFPTDGQVSLLVVMADRKTLEVGLIGREGMVGVPLAQGVDVSPVRAIVQGSGSAMRMNAVSFREALGRCLPLRQALSRHAFAQLAQARQIAACARFHQVEARLAFRLLLADDGVRADRFRLTHEFLAETLGIRRVGVTNAATDLQRRKLISYSRGKIRILDRKGLKAAACECYQIVRKLASSPPPAIDAELAPEQFARGLERLDPVEDDLGDGHQRCAQQQPPHAP